MGTEGRSKFKINYLNKAFNCDDKFSFISSFVDNKRMNCKFNQERLKLSRKTELNKFLLHKVIHEFTM